MSDWYGYPQAPGAHPQRPWWSRRDGRWTRAETADIPGFFEERGLYYPGGNTAEPTLARIDREHPLPAPPPRCGQVWVWLDGDGDWFPYRFEMLVVGVDHNGRACWANNPIGILSDGPWPPPGAVLVAGHGAPWAPPEWEPEEGEDG